MNFDQAVETLSWLQLTGLLFIPIVIVFLLIAFRPRKKAKPIPDEHSNMHKYQSDAGFVEATRFTHPGHNERVD